jgi:hypothetical protein
MFHGLMNNPVFPFHIPMKKLNTEVNKEIMKGEAINEVDAIETLAAVLNSNQMRSGGMSEGGRTTADTEVTGAVCENQCQR